MLKVQYAGPMFEQHFDLFKQESTALNAWRESAIRVGESLWGKSSGWSAAKGEVLKAAYVSGQPSDQDQAFASTTDCSQSLRLGRTCFSTWSDNGLNSEEK